MDSDHSQGNLRGGEKEIQGSPWRLQPSMQCSSPVFVLTQPEQTEGWQYDSVGLVTGVRMMHVMD